MNKFEKLFREFVREFGGELIPESVGEGEQRADYLFRAHRVIAELKTLEKAARDDHNRKVQELVNRWMRERRILVYGTVQLALRNLQPDLQREWLSILERPVEGLMRKAQRQIRSTKDALGAEDSTGLLIIANAGNLLYTTPDDFMAVVARVLKKKNNGSLRYPDIHTVLYFSTRGQWRFGTIQLGRYSEVEHLQQELLKAWVQFLQARVKPESTTRS